MHSCISKEDVSAVPCPPHLVLHIVCRQCPQTRSSFVRNARNFAAGLKNADDQVYAALRPHCIPRLWALLCYFGQHGERCHKDCTLLITCQSTHLMRACMVQADNSNSTTQLPEGADKPWRRSKLGFPIQANPMTSGQGKHRIDLLQRRQPRAVALTALPAGVVQRSVSRRAQTPLQRSMATALQLLSSANAARRRTPDLFCGGWGSASSRSTVASMACSLLTSSC